MVALTVAPLASADRSSWELLWQEYLTFYGTGLAPEVTAETFRRLVDVDEPRMVGFAARLGDRLVGIAHVVTSPNTWSPATDAYLEDLAVAGDVRGQGIGAALIEGITTMGRANGWRKVHWITDDDNVRAQRLYDHVAARTAYIRYELVIDDSDGDGSG